MKISLALILSVLFGLIGTFGALVEAGGKEGGSNIVMKDGHLILSTSGKKDKGGDNIVIKDDNKCCECGWW